MAHNYSNTASQAVLDAPLNNSATSFSVTSFTGYPSPPYWILMDRDTASSEVMEVTSVAGATLSVVRGQGGTNATTHSAGATVEHVIPAAVPQSVEQHVEATSGVHGVTGALVGTASADTLTNKTYQGAHVHSYSASQPANPAGGFVVNADSAIERDGFVANNTNADEDRRGFLLTQNGTPRVEAFYDGTLKVTPAGASARPAIETAGLVKAGDLEVTGDLTLGGTLSSSGSLALGAVSASGAITANGSGTGLAVTNNATVGGTLGVTGATTLAGATSTGGIATTGSTAGFATAGGSVVIGGNGRLQLPTNGTGNGTAVGQVRHRSTVGLEWWNGSNWRGAVTTGDTQAGTFSGTTSTSPRTIAAVQFPDIGQPYYALAQGQCEFNGVSAGTRWDLAIRLGSASAATDEQYCIGPDASIPYVQTGLAVIGPLTGVNNVYFVATRVFGSGSLTIGDLNQFFTTMQVSAT